LYKQTQSGAARVGSAEQFCRTKRIPAVDRGCQGRNVRNKAKPGRLGASGGPDSGRRADAPNKPNSRRDRLGQGLRHEGLLCKTKPIHPPRARKWARGLGRQVPPGSHRAKRTQFAAQRQERPSSRSETLAMPPRTGAMAPNKPNLAARPGDRDRMCQTNPISGRGTWHGHPARESEPSAGCRCHCAPWRHHQPVGDPTAIVPNKPNSRLRRAALLRPSGPAPSPRLLCKTNAIARSEAPRPWRPSGAPIVPVFHHSTIPVLRLSCKTRYIAFGAPPRACPSGGRPRRAAPTHFTLQTRPKAVRARQVRFLSTAPCSQPIICRVDIHESTRIWEI
jgi:hypothetical protein